MGSPPPAVDVGGTVRITVWVLGTSLVVYRRVLLSAACTLRRLHGGVQVAKRWQDLHY